MHDRRRFGHTGIAVKLYGRQVTGCHGDLLRLVGAAFVEGQVDGWPRFIGTQSRQILLRWAARQITGDPEEFGLHIHKISTDDGHFVAADESQCIAPRVRVIELLGNHGVAAHDDIARLFSGLDVHLYCEERLSEDLNSSLM